MTNVLHPGQNASQTQWLINVVVNGGGQSIVAGILSNSSLGQMCTSCQGDIPAYPLQITAKENPETEIFPIETKQGSLTQYYATYEIGSVSVTGFWKDQYNATAAPVCPPSYNGYTYNNEWDYKIPTKIGAVIGFGGNTAYEPSAIRVCIYSNKVGDVYSIDTNPYQVFSTDLTFTSNGRSETLTISNANQSGTAQTSQGDVQVQWPGSLVTLNPTTYSQGEVAVNNYQSQSWVISSSTQYNTYQSDSQRTYSLLNPSNIQATNIDNSTIPNYGCTGLVPNTNPSAYNYSNQSLQSLAQCLYGTSQRDYSQTGADISALLSGGSTLGGYPATLTSYKNQNSFSISIPNYFTTNPELDLRLSGTFIGVVIPLGKPKILSIVPAQLRSGGNGTINVNVENIGGGTGSFYYSLSNCTGITSPTSSKYSIAPNNTQQINIPIIATSSNQTISDRCSVTITDYNGGGSDTAQVSVTVKPPNQCDPGSQTVEGSSICPCLNESGIWKVGIGTSCTTCQYGVITNTQGAHICAPQPQTTSIKPQVTTIPTTTISYNNTISHKDVVIVTIGSRLNEDTNYKTALSSYESLLTSEGLSYVYIELNSYNPAMDTTDWQSIKNTINRIEYLAAPEYLIILGDTNIIPMPTVYNPVPFDSNGSQPYEIPTDDPYGSLYNNNIPSIVVARVPGSSGDEIATFLQNAIKKHNSGGYNLLIVGDGLDQPFQNAFVKDDTNSFSESTTGLSCQDNTNCLYAPPYCLGLLCNQSTSLKSDISSKYGIQYYDCHGDGYGCMDYYGVYPILDTIIAWVPTLNTNPIIMTSACHDGIINSSIPLTNTLAIQMLDDGASVYIGNTKYGYGGLSPTELEYVYNTFKSGKTIGQAFLAMKKHFLANPYDYYQEGTAQELQLYGDPTINYGG